MRSVMPVKTGKTQIQGLHMQKPLSSLGDKCRWAGGGGLLDRIQLLPQIEGFSDTSSPRLYHTSNVYHLHSLY